MKYSPKQLWKHKTGGDVNGVSISRDGEYVAAGTRDKYVYFFNRTGKLLWKHKTGGRSNSVLSVSISRDGEYVAAGTRNGYVYFFSVNRSSSGGDASSTNLTNNISNPASISSEIVAAVYRFTVGRFREYQRRSRRERRRIEREKQEIIKMIDEVVESERQRRHKK